MMPEGEVVVEGRPALPLSDEQRQCLAGLLAEVLLEALSGTAPASTRPVTEEGDAA